MHAQPWLTLHCLPSRPKLPLPFKTSTRKPLMPVPACSPSVTRRGRMSPRFPLTKFLSNPCAALSAAVPLAPPASGVTTSAKPCRRLTLTRVQEAQAAVAQPCGDGQVEGHTHRQARASTRKTTPAPNLQALGELPDPQTGLLLLRHCAAYTPMVFALRVTPPQLLAGAASDFDSEVRACLERLCTGPLTGQAWLAASVPLGLRHAARHAAAACVASLSAVLPRCQCLDPCYTSAWPLAATATALLNQSLLPADHLSPSIRQQPLSQALDRAVVEQPLGPIFCYSGSRAGAWLHAVPCEALGLDIAPDLFRVLVKLRLRLPVAAACPLCDGVADRFGDHALGCPCGGDRSVLAARAQAAGLHPEVEKPGLLPPRSDQDGLPEDGVRDRNGRR